MEQCNGTVEVPDEGTAVGRNDRTSSPRITSSISLLHHFIYLIISQASDRSGIRGAINGEKVESYWIVNTIRLVTSLIKIKLPLRLLLPILLQQLTTIEIDR